MIFHLQQRAPTRDMRLVRYCWYDHYGAVKETSELTKGGIKEGRKPLIPVIFVCTSSWDDLEFPQFIHFWPLQSELPLPALL